MEGEKDGGRGGWRERRMEGEEEGGRGGGRERRREGEKKFQPKRVYFFKTGVGFSDCPSKARTKLLTEPVMRCMGRIHLGKVK